MIRNYFSAYRFAADASKQTLVRPAPVVAKDNNKLFVYGFIDSYFGVSASQILSEMAPMKGNITVHINSDGGDVYEGVAIASALQAHKKTGARVDTVVDGIAASCASMLLMVGDKRSASEAGLVMIHSPSTGSWGNARDLRATADLLDTVESASMIPFYAKSGKTQQELLNILHAETWYTAQQAKDNGFVTDVLPVATDAKGVDGRRALALAQLYENFPIAALGGGTVDKPHVRGRVLSLNVTPTTVKT